MTPDACLRALHAGLSGTLRVSRIRKRSAYVLTYRRGGRRLARYQSQDAGTCVQAAHRDWAL